MRQKGFTPILIIICLAVLTLLVYSFVRNSKSDTFRNLVTYQPVPSPDAYNQTVDDLPSMPSDFPVKEWNLSLSNDELKADPSFGDKFLFYAVKKGYTTTLHRRNLNDGSEVRVIEFDEFSPGSRDGNLWNGFTPSVSVSRDGRKVVYVDKEGLKIYNLEDKSYKTLIKRVSDIKGRNAQIWSISELSAYNLVDPLFSGDDMHISFMKSQYEGYSFGTVDLEGKYKSLNLGSGNVVWANSGNAYLISNVLESFFDQQLYFANSFDMEPVGFDKFISTKEHVAFGASVFSEDNKKILFLYSFDMNLYRVGEINTDGSNFFSITDEAKYQPFLSYSIDGQSVFYIRKYKEANVLFEQNLNIKKILSVTVLPKEFDLWHNGPANSNGYISLIGLKSNASVAGAEAKLIVIDLANKKAIYAGKTFSDIVNFLKLTR